MIVLSVGATASVGRQSELQLSPGWGRVRGVAVYLMTFTAKILVGQVLSGRLATQGGFTPGTFRFEFTGTKLPEL